MAESCFVIMPYGKKKDIDGREVDFDGVYRQMIKPAVESIDGLTCARCDDIDQAGWIHERMVRNIFDARVAIVDTSTLNANVFYELGVRHALRRSVTVMIHREGTTWPFNIAGLSSIEYQASKAGMARAQGRITSSIANGLKMPDETDSLVYFALPALQVQRTPRRLTSFDVFPYRLQQDPERRIAFVSGDREDISLGDVWVSSENTNMQMDNLYGRSTSATIRYLGAKKDHTGILEDTIAHQLNEQMKGAFSVAPGTVVCTQPGELSRNGVKWILHVAAVTGEPREGYRPVQRIDQCVKNVLRRMGDPELGGVSSVLFPIFGTGPGGGDFMTHARTCVEATIEHLTSVPTPIRDVYFYVWSDVDLELCRAIADNHPLLSPAE